MKRLPLSLFLACFFALPGAATAQSSTPSEWEYSFGARVWYAGWDREENVTQSSLQGSAVNNPTPQNGGGDGDGGNNGGGNNQGSDADPLPFYSFYADALKDDWRISLAAGFSGEYEFRNDRSDDDFERMDLQLSVEKRLNDIFAAGVGLHYIDNSGSTEGQGRDINRQTFEYSFTGPEATLGAALPLYANGQTAVAATLSGTFGYYMVDNNAEFESVIDDTAGYTVDAGLVGLIDRWQVKVGYRRLHINDSIWSIDRITEGPQGLERERVDTSETFDGIYVEATYDF